MPRRGQRNQFRPLHCGLDSEKRLCGHMRHVRWCTCDCACSCKMSAHHLRSSVSSSAVPIGLHIDTQECIEKMFRSNVAAQTNAGTAMPGTCSDHSILHHPRTAWFRHKLLDNESQIHTGHEILGHIILLVLAECSARVDSSHSPSSVL